MTSSVEALHRRLAERLGRVCGGSIPRFSWQYAPDQPWLVYDRDERTVLKKSWADMPAPDGSPIGKSFPFLSLPNLTSRPANFHRVSLYLVASWNANSSKESAYFTKFMGVRPVRL